MQYVCHIARATQVEGGCEMGMKRFATASKCRDALQVCFVRQLSRDAKISFHKKKGRVWIGFFRHAFREPFGAVSGE